MTAIREPIFSGHREVHGYFFSHLIMDDRQMRGRILGLWGSRCRLYQVDQGYVLKLGKPQWRDTGLAPGLPFVGVGTLFATAPLRPREISRLGCTRGDWVLVLGGCGRVLNLSTENEVNPGIWLNLADYSLLKMKPLCAPPKLEIQQPEEIANEVLAEAVPDRKDKIIQQLLASLESKKDAAGIAGGTRSGWRSLVWKVLHRLQKPARPSQPQTGHDPVKPKTPLPGVSLFRKWFNKVGVALLFRRQHAQFLGKMIRYFEKGDLDQALRHAIPLSGDAEPQNASPLGFLRPRKWLPLGSGSGGGSGSSLFFEDGFYQYLMDHYEAAFNRLNAMGDLEKAAYVLETLLNQPERAVRYLEEKGLLNKAAQVAQSRNLPPGWVIRLLFQIGDREGALLWARRTGAFFEGLKMLEKRDQEQALAWRVLWARHLARSGDYGAAVDVAWPVPELHRVAANWIDLALEEGGEPSARLLAKSLHLKKNHLDDTLLRIKALFSEDGEMGPGKRRVFADSLLDLNASGVVRWVAHGLMRPLIKDHARGLLADPRPLFKKLNLLAGSSAMTPELKVLGQKSGSPSKSAPNSSSEPRNYRLQEKGAAPVFDCILGPDGRLLVALGEAGFDYISRGGKLIFHGETPAFQWVSSDLGNRLLTLAERDGWLDLNRIDLQRRRVQALGMIPKECAAADFDGAHWYLALNQSLTALDAHENKLVEIWRVPDLPGRVLSIARDPSRLRMLVEISHSTWEQWTYELPKHRLFHRQTISWDNQKPLVWDLQPSGLLTVVTMDYPGEGEPFPGEDTGPNGGPGLKLARFQHGKLKRTDPLGQSAWTNLTGFGDLLLLREKRPSGGMLHLLDETHLKTLAKIQYEGTVKTRFSSRGLLIATGAGCVYLCETGSFELRCLYRT